MKKIIFFISIIILAVIAVFVWCWFTIRVSTNFATEARLEFHYRAVPGGHNPDTNISVVITDEDELSILKEILRGWSFRDHFHCGFSTEISITMANGDRSIMFFPAHDGCPILRIGDSDRYIIISEEQRIALRQLLEWHGMFFPFI